MATVHKHIVRCPVLAFWQIGYGQEAERRTSEAVVLTLYRWCHGGNHAAAVQRVLFLPRSGSRLFHGLPAAGRSAILRIFGRGKKKEKFIPYQFFLLTILFIYFRDFNPITVRSKSLIKQ
ncbi:hypothetical protein ACI65C_002939 [Semiaphis heraclei]